MSPARRAPWILIALGIFFFFAAVAPPARCQQFDESLWKGMKYRLIGPFRGGRVLAVTGVAGDANTYYFGAVSGGVWKTTDGGVTWTALTDKEKFASVGSLAVAPSDPNVIYVGTGEACIRGNISYGNGVYKSVDAGKTWTHLGLEDTRHIGRVIVDPRNPDVVFVAALGHAFGKNAERGVFRTTDGGKSWEKVLYKDDKTGAIDITFDPRNAHILYAALWEAHRTPWSMESGGAGSGLYKSSDGGTTWRRLEGHGLPEGMLGRIGVAVGADANRVYALIEAEQGGLYRSDDAGETWEKVNEDHRFRQRAWYFTHIFADPKSNDTLYILNTGLFRSTDGGHKFALLPAPHGDHHGLWIDPTNAERLINGNDGGVTITVDGGKTWTRQDNQPTAQFYHVITDNRFFYYVYGAQQDNTSVGIASRTEHGAIDDKDWYAVGGGESGYIAPDPRDPEIIYAGDNGGTITRMDRHIGQTQDISIWPENYSGYGDGELTHRFQWTAPIVFSPHDPNVLYQGGELLFKTSDGGHSWTAISGDLTRNDKSKQAASGGPITKDNTSVEYYDTIFAIAESPVAKDQIWVGSDDGLVHLTRDAGKNWDDVTPKGMPEWSLVSLIEASPQDAARAYLAIDRHKWDDSRPYIYETNDYGKTWKQITNGIPDGSYVHAVREDPKRKGMLFAGTETGIFVSFDDGGRWQPLQLNLPTVPVHDLVIHGDDLVVATHGRSFWILDDIAPLRQAAADIAGKDIHLYQPQTAYRTRTGDPAPERLLHWYGKNGPGGAVIDYYLRSAPTGEVTLEILDAEGKLVRKLSNKLSPSAEQEQQEWPDQERQSDLLPAEAGMNRFVWDLRYQPPTLVPGQVFDGGEEPHGPFAAPGRYQLRMTVAGKTETAPLEVRLDPRLKVTPEDLKKQLELALQVRERLSQTDEAVNQIRDVRAQLEALRRRWKDDPKAKEILDAAEAIGKKSTPVEEALVNKNIKATEDTLNYPVRIDNRLSTLADVIESADTAPTEASYAVLEDLTRQLETQLAAWKEIREKDLAALNELMRKQDIPAIAPTPEKMGDATLAK
jgi:photosystem II stability/assembly factor-like uncharacterized protein